MPDARTRSQARSDLFFYSLIGDIITMAVAALLLFCVTRSGLNTYFNLPIDMASALTALAVFVFGRSMLIAFYRWLGSRFKKETK